MKIITLKKNKKKLPLFDLLRLRSYKKKQPDNFSYNSKHVELYLKKTLSIIYKYHIRDKKILFFEFPETFNKVLRQTEHVLISDSVYFGGFLNDITYSKNLNHLLRKQTKIPSNILRILLKLNKKIDLIVIYNPNGNYRTLLKESSKSKVPTIKSYTSNNIQQILDLKETYRMNTNYDNVYEKKPNNKFFYSIIKTIMKKTILNRKKPREKRPILQFKTINKKKKQTRKKQKKYKKF